LKRSRSASRALSKLSTAHLPIVRCARLLRTILHASVTKFSFCTRLSFTPFDPAQLFHRLRGRLSGSFVVLTGANSCWRPPSQNLSLIEPAAVNIGGVICGTKLQAPLEPVHMLESDCSESQNPSEPKSAEICGLVLLNTRVLRSRLFSAARDSPCDAQAMMDGKPAGTFGSSCCDE